MGRIIRLLDRKALTPRQRAQRKYRRSAKGRAANKRAFDKWMAKPENRAKNVARVKKWAEDNPVRRRVYNRIYKRVHYKPVGIFPVGTGQLQYVRTCACGRTVRGNGFTNHVRACAIAQTAMMKVAA